MFQITKKELIAAQERKAIVVDSLGFITGWVCDGEILEQGGEINLYTYADRSINPDQFTYTYFGTMRIDALVLDPMVDKTKVWKFLRIDMSGNTPDYYVDGMLCKQKEYLDGLIVEKEEIKQITNDGEKNE